MKDIPESIKRVLPGSYDRIPEDLKKPITADELARIEKAKKEREANKVGKNDNGPMKVEK